MRVDVDMLSVNIIFINLTNVKITIKSIMIDKFTCLRVTQNNYTVEN